MIIAQPDGSRFRVSLTLADNAIPPALGDRDRRQRQRRDPERGHPAAGYRPRLCDARRTGRHHRRRLDRAARSSPSTRCRSPSARASRTASPTAQAGRTHVLNIGSIQVTSGQIRRSSGYHDCRPLRPAHDRQRRQGRPDRVQLAPAGRGDRRRRRRSTRWTSPTASTLTSGPGISIGRRPEPAQRRQQRHPRQRGVDQRRPVRRPHPSASQGDRHRLELPRPEPGADRHGQLVRAHAVDLGLHPGRPHHRTGQLVPDRQRHRQQLHPRHRLGLADPVLINGALNVISVTQQLVIPNLTIFNQVVPGQLRRSERRRPERGHRPGPCLIRSPRDCLSVSANATAPARRASPRRGSR